MGSTGLCGWPMRPIRGGIAAPAWLTLSTPMVGGSSAMGFFHAQMPRVRLWNSPMKEQENGRLDYRPAGSGSCAAQHTERSRELFSATPCSVLAIATLVSVGRSGVIRAHRRRTIRDGCSPKAAKAYTVVISMVAASLDRAVPHRRRLTIVGPQ